MLTIWQLTGIQISTQPAVTILPHPWAPDSLFLPSSERYWNPCSVKYSVQAWSNSWTVMAQTFFGKVSSSDVVRDIEYPEQGFLSPSMQFPWCDLFQVLSNLSSIVSLINWH
jgi:hypothetical protein